MNTTAVTKGEARRMLVSEVATLAQQIETDVRGNEFDAFEAARLAVELSLKAWELAGKLAGFAPEPHPAAAAA